MPKAAAAASAAEAAKWGRGRLPSMTPPAKRAPDGPLQASVSATAPSAPKKSEQSNCLINIHPQHEILSNGPINTIPQHELQFNGLMNIYSI